MMADALAEAVRLLRAHGGLVYLRAQDPEVLRCALDVGLDERLELGWIRDLHLPVGRGMFGRAVADSRVLATGDYLADPSFAHLPEPDRFVREMGIRSMIVAPVVSRRRSLGAMGVFSTRQAAFDEADVALVRSLAEHAGSAVHNAELIRQLATSRRQLTRRFEVEHTLREMAGQLTVVRDPRAVLQLTVDAAAALLHAQGARIDLLDEASKDLLWAFDATTGSSPGLGPIGSQTDADVGTGVSGRAVRLGRPVWTGEYLADRSFRHAPGPDSFAAEHGIRSALAAPIRGEGGVLGTLTVYSQEPDAYGPDDAAMIATLAGQASIAITNARLIEALGRSREDLAQRAEVERALREITAEIAAVRDPQEILHLIAREGARLLGTERVFINVLNDPDGEGGWTWYSPSEVGRDPWPAAEAIRLGEGVTGKAIAERRPFITGDYLHDERFVHRPGPDGYTEALALPSAIAVPVFDGDTAIGALLGEAGEPDAFDEEDAARLEILARQAGIALSNARLLERLRESERQLRESEARYRYLVTASPDVMWEVDLEGHFTFASDALRPLTGRDPAELVGQHFAVAISPDTLPDAIREWEALLADPMSVHQAHFSLLHQDGRAIPVENFATGVYRDGVLVGAHGSARDLSERDRLERDLRRQAAELAAGEERAHLARELHDSVTQALFAMTLVSRSIELLIERDPKAALARFADLRELQREALTEMRSLIFELQPGSIERDGLEEALRQHARGLSSRIGLPIVVEVDLSERLPLAAEETLYRIAQEALHNVVKHASAHQAWVRIGRVETEAILEVEDDGRGFDPSAVAEGHVGLAGMQARAGRADGSLAIRSRPGAGATVTVRLPLDARAPGPPAETGAPAVPRAG